MSIIPLSFFFSSPIFLLLYPLVPSSSTVFIRSFCTTLVAAPSPSMCPVVMTSLSSCSRDGLLVPLLGGHAPPAASRRQSHVPQCLCCTPGWQRASRQWWRAPGGQMCPFARACFFFCVWGKTTLSACWGPPGRADARLSHYFWLHPTPNLCENTF